MVSGGGGSGGGGGGGGGEGRWAYVVTSFFNYF